MLKQQCDVYGTDIHTYKVTGLTSMIILWLSKNNIIN